LVWPALIAVQPGAAISDAEIREILIDRANTLAPNQTGIGIVCRQ